MGIFQLAFNTVLLRPYVFVFLAAFLFISIINMGSRRTFVFLAITWIIAFVSEYSATRNGFPFGLYTYTELTKGSELFLSNIPFFDSLSFTFLLYAAFSMSLFFIAPLKFERRNLRILDTFELRQSKKVLIATTFFMMMIDVVIDPVALQGKKWFLGDLYYYNYSGYYFGVPLSNTIGWGFVGFVSIWIYQRIEKKYMSVPIVTKRNIPYQNLMGTGLYYGVLLFMLSICVWINDWFLLIGSSFIFLLPTLMLVIRCLDPKVRGSEDEFKKHCENFPVT